MTPFAQLQAEFPWPDEVPDLPFDPHGMLPRDFDNLRSLRTLPYKQLVILEIGSWLGASARWWLRGTGRSKIICVDPWTGNKEHQDTDREEVTSRLPRLQDQFLANMRQFHSRVVPVPLTSAEALPRIAELGVQPHVVYIDGSHEYDDVVTDLNMSYRLFPDAYMCGDDFSWKHPDEDEGQPVMRALSTFIEKHPEFTLIASAEGSTWRLRKK